MHVDITVVVIGTHKRHIKVKYRVTKSNHWFKNPFPPYTFMECISYLIKTFKAYFLNTRKMSTDTKHVSILCWLTCFKGIIKLVVWRLVKSTAMDTHWKKFIRLVILISLSIYPIIVKTCLCHCTKLAEILYKNNITKDNNRPIPLLTYI